MLIDLNWYECNKILRLLKDSHNHGITYSGDEELQRKIESHRHSIEADKQWQLLESVPYKLNDTV